MPRLIAINGQDEISIDGLADMGTEVVFFFSEEGEEPDIVADLTFNKKDFSSYEAFQTHLADVMPEYVFLKDRPEVNSLNYEDLIDICATSFPDLKYDTGETPETEEPEGEEEEPEEKTGKQRQMPPEKLKEIVNPDQNPEPPEEEE